jgi:hypothetical protein
MSYPKLFQDPPRLGNTFTEDTPLQACLQRYLSALPKSQQAEITRDLEAFGGRCGSDLYAMSVEMEHNRPSLVQFDAWGNRVDEIRTCPQWKVPF